MEQSQVVKINRLMFYLSADAADYVLACRKKYQKCISDFDTVFYFTEGKC